MLGISRTIIIILFLSSLNLSGQELWVRAGMGASVTVSGQEFITIPNFEFSYVKIFNPKWSFSVSPSFQLNNSLIDVTDSYDDRYMSVDYRFSFRLKRYLLNRKNGQISTGFLVGSSMISKVIDLDPEFNYRIKRNSPFFGIPLYYTHAHNSLTFAGGVDFILNYFNYDFLPLNLTTEPNNVVKNTKLLFACINVGYRIK